MTNLTDKIAIVTGAGRDIGRAIAVDFAQRGAKVVVNYRSNEADADGTLAEIAAVGGTAVKIKADVTKADEVETLVAQTREAFGGKIDILANVAGGMVERRALADMVEQLRYVDRSSI